MYNMCFGTFLMLLLNIIHHSIEITQTLINDNKMCK